MTDFPTSSPASDASSASGPKRTSVAPTNPVPRPEGGPDPVRLPPVGTLMERMQMEFLNEDPDNFVVRMPVTGNVQSFGRLHGGATAALAETAGSYAAGLHAARVHPGEDAVAVGVDLNITHHRAAREGWVTATARPLHAGRTTATHEVVITDAEGRRISTARITNLILRGRPEGANLDRGRRVEPGANDGDAESATSS